MESGYASRTTPTWRRACVLWSDMRRRWAPSWPRRRRGRRRAWGLMCSSSWSGGLGSRMGGAAGGVEGGGVEGGEHGCVCAAAAGVVGWRGRRGGWKGGREGQAEMEGTEGCLEVGRERWGRRERGAEVWKGESIWAYLPASFQLMHACVVPNFSHCLHTFPAAGDGSGSSWSSVTEWTSSC